MIIVIIVIMIAVIGRRFYYHKEYVHGGRREFHGGVKKTTSSLENCVCESRMERIDSTLLSDLLRSAHQSRDKGASSWLTAVLLVDQGLVLNKQEFRDSPRLRYNMPLSDLPSKCVCGEKPPSAIPCHAKRDGSWHRDTMVFAT